MLKPVSNESSLTIPTTNDPKNNKTTSKEKEEITQINVSFSEKAQDLKIFQNEKLLFEQLQKEFNEFFDLNEDHKDSFLRKLDHILEKSRL